MKSVNEEAAMLSSLKAVAAAAADAMNAAAIKKSKKSKKKKKESVPTEIDFKLPLAFGSTSVSIAIHAQKIFTRAAYYRFFAIHNREKW